MENTQVSDWTATAMRLNLTANLNANIARCTGHMIEILLEILKRSPSH